jgi:hypothetical protein
MHPYREAVMRTDPLPDTQPDTQIEEAILYTLLMVIGAIPVAVTLFRHAAFGVEATVGMMMVLAGLVGAISRRREPVL